MKHPHASKSQWQEDQRLLEPLELFGDHILLVSGNAAVLLRGFTALRIPLLLPPEEKGITRI